MRALLIDPRAETITEVDLKGGDVDHVRQMTDLMGVDLFSTVTIQRNEEGGTTMFVDDMGMYRAPLYCDDIFKYAGYPIPLIGKAMVLGNNPGGETVDCTMTVEDLAKWITFASNFCPEGEFQCLYLETEAEA